MTVAAILGLASIEIRTTAEIRERTERLFAREIPGLRLARDLEFAFERYRSQARDAAALSDRSLLEEVERYANPGIREQLEYLREIEIVGASELEPAFAAYLSTSQRVVAQVIDRPADPARVEDLRSMVAEASRVQSELRELRDGLETDIERQQASLEGAFQNQLLLGLAIVVLTLLGLTFIFVVSRRPETPPDGETR